MLHLYQKMVNNSGFFKNKKKFLENIYIVSINWYLAASVQKKNH